MPSQDFTLGRAGLATSAGGDGLVLHLRDEDGFSQEGDRASLEGILKGSDFSSLADLKAARDQLQGYGPDNTDEPVVPVTWVQDPSRDGFYRVLSVEVGAEASGRLSASSAAGKLAIPWRAELLRVPGWQAPLFEIRSSGAHRGGGAVATGDPWLAIPQASGVSTPFASSDLSFIPGSTSFTGDNGTAVILYTTGDQLYDAAIEYFAETEHFYKVACGIEFTRDSGTTWRTVVGRQIPADADGWRLNNHCTRVSIVGNDLRVERYDSGAAAWEATDFTPTHSPSGAAALFATGVAGLTVLCNRPEFASIQVCVGSLVRLQVSIRRGGGLVECRVSGYDNVYGVYRDASEAGTSITGGIEATSANAAGNKYIMLSPDTITKDVTGVSGIELTASGTEFNFGIGVSNVDLANSNVTAIEEYFAANNVRQKIVAG